MSGVAVFRQSSSSCQAVTYVTQSTKTRKRVAYLGAVAIELPCSCGAVAVELLGIGRAVTPQSLGSCGQSKTNK